MQPTSTTSTSAFLLSSQSRTAASVLPAPAPRPHVPAPTKTTGRFSVCRRSAARSSASSFSPAAHAAGNGPRAMGQVGLGDPAQVAAMLAEDRRDLQRAAEAAGVQQQHLVISHAAGKLLADESVRAALHAGDDEVSARNGGGEIGGDEIEGDFARGISVLAQGAVEVREIGGELRGFPQPHRQAVGGQHVGRGAPPAAGAEDGRSLDQWDRHGDLRRGVVVQQAVAQLPGR